jgi:DivIVA domain-containing protein
MLTPDEIELKTFAVTLRGFDQIEVTTFLQAVAAQLQSALERAEALRPETVREAANRAAAEVMAKAEALTSSAVTMRDEASLIKKAAADEASRLHADALASSERELKQAVQDCEEFRLKAVDDIESILKRTDAEVSAMLQAVRDSREGLLGVGQPLMPRNKRKGSQRQLGQ